MTIIGIDPGLTGAVVALGNGCVPRISDTPTFEARKGKKNKTDYLPAEMAELIRTCAVGASVHAYIEQVSAMPGQGVTSMFGFGKGFGLWLGILAALQVPYTLVTPQAWKKAMMHGKGDKDAARIRAQELFPGCVSQLSRKKDIGRADALLIAEYGRTLTPK